MPKRRNYKREYALYHGKKEQIKRRAARNKGRALAVKEGSAKKGDGKDVDHKDRNPKNNSKKNRRTQSKSTNRSFSRKGEKGHGPKKKRK